MRSAVRWSKATPVERCTQRRDGLGDQVTGDRRSGRSPETRPMTEIGQDDGGFNQSNHGPTWGEHHRSHPIHGSGTWFSGWRCGCVRHEPKEITGEVGQARTFGCLRLKSRQLPNRKFNQYRFVGFLRHFNVDLNPIDCRENGWRGPTTEHRDCQGAWSFSVGGRWGENCVLTCTWLRR